MDSWWQLGEGYGQLGENLALYRITCPFCLERGNLDTAFHAEKKKPNSDKKLNFDTLKCGNCGGYVMVLWSASEHGFGQGLYDYRVLPFYILRNILNTGLKQLGDTGFKQSVTSRMKTGMPL